MPACYQPGYKPWKQDREMPLYPSLQHVRESEPLFESLRLSKDQGSQFMVESWSQF